MSQITVCTFFCIHRNVSLRATQKTAVSISTIALLVTNKNILYKWKNMRISSSAFPAYRKRNNFVTCALTKLSQEQSFMEA